MAATNCFSFRGGMGHAAAPPMIFFRRVRRSPDGAGNFFQPPFKTGIPGQDFNPPPGQHFQLNGIPNAIDPANISSAAQNLLQFIPLPNIATTASGQNFHTVTSGASTSDAVNLRLIHNFGAAPSDPMQIGPGGGGGGGGRGGRRNQHNINFGLNWQRSSIDSVGIFPSLDGGTGTQGLSASVGWVYGKGRVTNNLRVNYNHNHVSTTN